MSLCLRTGCPVAPGLEPFRLRIWAGKKGSSKILGWEKWEKWELKVPSLSWSFWPFAFPVLAGRVDSNTQQLFFPALARFLPAVQPWLVIYWYLLPECWTSYNTWLQRFQIWKQLTNLNLSLGASPFAVALLDPLPCHEPQPISRFFEELMRHVAVLILTQLPWTQAALNRRDVFHCFYMLRCQIWERKNQFFCGTSSFSYAWWVGKSGKG